jgi:ADP-ribose pyrophosphatase YjhB (NUDIX family)
LRTAFGRHADEEEITRHAGWSPHGSVTSGFGDWVLLVERGIAPYKGALALPGVVLQGSGADGHVVVIVGAGFK